MFGNYLFLQVGYLSVFKLPESSQENISNKESTLT